VFIYIYKYTRLFNDSDVLLTTNNNIIWAVDLRPWWKSCAMTLTFIFELQTGWHICIVDYFFQSKRAAILLTSCKSQNFKIRRKAGYRIRVMRIKHKSQSVPAMHEDDLRASKFIVTPLRWLFDEFRTPDKRTEGRTDDLKTQCVHPFGRGIKYCYYDCYCFLHYMHLIYWSLSAVYSNSSLLIYRKC